MSPTEVPKLTLEEAVYWLRQSEADKLGWWGWRDRPAWTYIRTSTGYDMPAMVAQLDAVARSEVARVRALLATLSGPDSADSAALGKP